MTETPAPPSPSPSPAPPSPNVQAPGGTAAPSAPAVRGSLALGVVLAWACLIGGYFVVGVFVSAIGSLIRGGSDFVTLIALLSCLAPWIAMLVLAIWFAKKGEPRTALGIGVGVGSIVGILLLLVAACFGLMSGTNFH